MSLHTHTSSILTYFKHLCRLQILKRKPSVNRANVDLGNVDIIDTAAANADPQADTGIKKKPSVEDLEMLVAEAQELPIDVSQDEILINELLISAKAWLQKTESLGDECLLCDDKKMMIEKYRQHLLKNSVSLPSKNATADETNEGPQAMSSASVPVCEESVNLACLEDGGVDVVESDDGEDELQMQDGEEKGLPESGALSNQPQAVSSGLSLRSSKASSSLRSRSEDSLLAAAFLFAVAPKYEMLSQLLKESKKLCGKDFLNFTGLCFNILRIVYNKYEALLEKRLNIYDWAINACSVVDKTVMKGAIRVRNACINYPSKFS